MFCRKVDKSRCQSFVAISSLTVLKPKFCPFVSVEMVGVFLIVLIV